MLALGSGIALLIVSLVVFTSLISGIFPSVISSLNSLNNSGKVINASGYWTNANYTTVPLRAVIASDGIIPLIVVAIFVILVVIGLFAFLKSGKKR